MARSYRFFVRNLAAETFEQNQGRVFHLTENLEPDIYYQLTKVLRVKPGDGVVLLPAMQQKPFFEYVYSVQDVQKNDIVLNLQNKELNENELPLELGLILCLPNRPDKLEFILEKAVELGVTHIELVEGNFSQMKHRLRADRLEKIIAEAAEQSERAVLPKLSLHGSLTDYLQILPSGQRKNVWVALERAVDGREMSIYDSLKNKPEAVSILVGPEGGFSPEEVILIEESGIRYFSLGKRILRMETAVILSLGLFSIPLPLQ